MTEKLTAKQQLHNFPDDLEMSINARLEKAMSCDNILLCGMGGSGISNAIAYDCLYIKTKFVKIIRTPLLPSWANSRTLAIISSYSGNTVETLEMYNNAMEKKCKIIVITAGGKLRELAEENGHITFTLPSGMDPRHAIGYMTGFILAISRDVGGPDITGKMHRTIPSLKKYVKTLERSTLNPAKSIAKELMRKPTIVYYSKDVESVALRWKSQIAENAKYISIAEPIELFDEKYYGRTIRGKPAIIVISTNKTKTNAVRKMAYSGNLYFKEIKVGGENYIENLFKAIMLSDYTSVYMAELKKVDPRDVTPITNLKKLMMRKLK